MEYPEVVVETKPGIWFVYFEDVGAHPLYVSMDELEARRWSDENGYGDVMFWESGTSWDEFKKKTKKPQIVLDPAQPGL